MSLQSEGAASSFEAVYLIAIRLYAEGPNNLLYTLLLMDEDCRGGKDRPLTDSDGYTIWFTNPGYAEHALGCGDEGFRRHTPAPTNVAAVYDYPQLFWSVTTSDVDTGAAVLNGVSLLLDLVESTAFPFPAAYRKTLFELADHLTFSNDLGGFVNSRVDQRREIMDAITWCVGAVTIKSRLLSPAQMP